MGHTYVPLCLSYLKINWKKDYMDYKNIVNTMVDERVGFSSTHSTR
jgi:hypothetical protein